MAIGKEYIVPLERLARRQKAIYNDAADYGVYVTPAEAAEIKAALAGLKALEGGVSATWGSNAPGIGGSSYTTFLGIEVDEGVTMGYVVKVAYTRPGRGKKPYYTIDIARGTAPAWSKSGKADKHAAKRFYGTPEHEAILIEAERGEPF